MPLPTSVILPNLVVLYMLTYIVNYSDNAPAIYFIHCAPVSALCLIVPSELASIASG